MGQKEITLIVPSGKNPERLDIFLTHHIENATRTKIQQAIRTGNVVVNGIKVKPSHKVSPGETINIVLPRSAPTEIEPENIPLDIVYEDKFLLIVNKPAGMVTHPAFGHYSGTLVNALIYHYRDRLSCAYQKSALSHEFPRPGIVHRLDKDTSGLLIVAKDDATHAILAKEFAKRTAHREYVAIVWGRFSDHRKKHSIKNPLSGRIEAPLGRSKSDRKKITTVREGKEAITEYTVLEEFKYLSLVKCFLKTGRTHQIRVHMHHIGHPVFGDPTYGGRRIGWGGVEKRDRQQIHKLLTIMQRQALHAKSITFIHPITREKMSFEVDVPNDMKEVMKIINTK